MLDPQQLKDIVEQIQLSGFPLEHWASSLLRKEGWSVATNFYYLDSDDKKPREMDIVAFKETNLERFKVKTVLLVSCKKSQNSIWGFLRRQFPEVGNKKNLFPVMINSKVPSVNYSLRNWGWPRDFCDFMAAAGLSDWFGAPTHDVFAHQQIPTGTGGGKMRDSDMHGATTQLIKAQAYEMAGYHEGDVRRVTQFNLVSITEGDFAAIDFREDEKIHAEEISEQVSLASYKIDNRDHDSRIFYLTKKAFAERISRFGLIHSSNVKFFGEMEAKFRDGAVFDAERRMVYADDFIKRAKNSVLGQTRSFRSPPYTVPHMRISLSAESPNLPVVTIAADNPEVLDAASSSFVKTQLAGHLLFLWGYDGSFDVDVIDLIA